jgi:multicomponent Na+:H+ antiporter subunit D
MTAFIIAAFSMIGIPPTCGFFSKLYLILGSIEANQWFFVAMILLSSLLNVVYFVNVIRTIYFGPSEAEVRTNPEMVKQYAPAENEAPWSMRLPIIVTAAGILLLGVFNGTIISQVIQHIIPSSF